MNDIMTKLNYPKIGRITKVEKDTMGVERYYQVEYKKNKRNQGKGIPLCLLSNSHHISGYAK